MIAKNYMGKLESVTEKCILKNFFETMAKNSQVPHVPELAEGVLRQLTLDLDKNQC
jgi:hypothetical protein